jgi:hypothetical protein
MKKEFKVKERGLYDPKDKKPFKVSRSGIELFTECPCCFYLNNRLGIRRPSGPPFNINKAVDALLKKEFDVYRVKGAAHPYRLDSYTARDCACRACHPTFIENRRDGPRLRQMAGLIFFA